ncbi:putative HNHc nuclease [Enterococcus hailinensis]|uniref:putative HNHc nuclease n=1 Tax=Enterococcus hailinensis TaxID=3238988 RepID=UPI0038B3FB74
MLNVRVVGKQKNGDYIVRAADEDSQEELEGLIAQRKTLLTAQAFNPNKITRPQQKIAHALIRDINDYSNNERFIQNEEDELKIKFCIDRGLPFEKLFYLSNCSKDLATQFISWLVEYCFHHDIPFDGKSLYLVHDLNRKLFLSALHNRCFVTQARRQDAVLHIHHVNAVGIGKRSKVDHRGRYYMILRAELHNEIHQLGYEKFCEKWHVGAIKLTDQQILDFGLMSQKQMKELDDDPDYEIKDWQLPE